LSSESYALTDSVAEIAFLPFVFIGHCLYTFIVVVYRKTSYKFHLPDLQLLVCTPIKLDFS